MTHSDAYLMAHAQEIIILMLCSKNIKGFGILIAIHLEHHLILGHFMFTYIFFQRKLNALPEIVPDQVWNVYWSRYK